MALDEALMARAVEAGEWTLRVYAWDRPTLSLGRNQAARAAYDPATLESRGFPVVRRPTGGRAILHDAEVTYSVTAPLSLAGSLRDVYGRINEILVGALRRLGVSAAVAAAGARYAVPPGPTPCFDHPAPGEIVAGGRKLAGSAQWRDDHALLQHGSILVDGTQELVATLQRRPMPSPPAPATLRELLGRAPAFDEVAAALFDAVRELEDRAAEPLVPEPELAARTASLRTRFLDPAWTWRR